MTACLIAVFRICSQKNYMGVCFSLDVCLFCQNILAISSTLKVCFGLVFCNQTMELETYFQPLLWQVKTISTCTSIVVLYFSEAANFVSLKGLE